RLRHLLSVNSFPTRRSSDLESQLDDFYSYIHEHHSNFDVLINSIGVSECFPAIKSDFSSWDNPIQVMLYGTVKSCRLLVPLMCEDRKSTRLNSSHVKISYAV